jgi:hypothetical protein
MRGRISLQAAMGNWTSRRDLAGMGRQRSGGKGIDDDEPIVVLAVVQVFGENLAAAGGTGGLDDGRVPEGDLKPDLGRHGRLEQRYRVFLDGKAQPGVDEGDGLLMGQRLGAGGASGLDVKLLQNLDGERQVIPAEDQGGFKKAQTRGGDGLVPGSKGQNLKTRGRGRPRPFLESALVFREGLPPVGQDSR